MPRFSRLWMKYASFLSKTCLMKSQLLFLLFRISVKTSFDRKLETQYVNFTRVNPWIGFHFTNFCSLKHISLDIFYNTKDYKMESVFDSRSLNAFIEYRVHCLAKTWIYLTPYVCTEQILAADCSCTTKYFLKDSYKICSLNLYASFDTFCFQIGQLFEAQWDFKLSEEFEIDVIFLRKQRFVDVQEFFKGSLWLE